jgi:hypothetical protein
MSLYKPGPVSILQITRSSSGKSSARLFVIGARRKPEPPGIADRVLGQLARRLRRHPHRVPLWEETIYKALLVIGDTGELVESRRKKSSHGVHGDTEAF